MVQIAKEAISTKGPRLTADISLAGRNVVLVPFSSKIFISQKIRANETKKRLRQIAAKVLPKNFGVIIRTAAAEANDADIEQDILSLVERWNEAVGNIRKNQAPALLMSEMSRANTIIRDSLNSTFSQITVDDEAMYREIKNYIKVIDPQLEKIVKLYRGSVPIFDNFDISKQIKSLFAKYVSLKRGAYLIIEHTEAMNVIDVNSGNRTRVEENQEETAMAVNLAAAKEIARQLRLRDLGGIVIVDFIDLHKVQNRQALFNEMTKLMASDKAKHTILPLSKFGLMQITRQRVRPVAVQDVTDVCPTCNGTGRVEPTILLDRKIENQIQFLAEDRGVRYISLRVSPYVASYLCQGLISLRLRWMMRYKVWVDVVADQSQGMVDVKYLDRSGALLIE
jgi:ribonuclease G